MELVMQQDFPFWIKWNPSDTLYMKLQINDRISSEDFSITEDDLNYYIHGMLSDTGFSTANYTPIPKYMVRVEDEDA